MVLQKRLDYRFNGNQVLAIPQVPKSAKGKRSVRKKAEDNRMCAFDVLTDVAGKLLEGENPSTLWKLTGTSNRSNARDTVKQEQANEEKPLNYEPFDMGSCNGSTLIGSDFVIQRQISCKLKELSQTLKPITLGPASVIIKSDTSYRDACTEIDSPGVEKLYESKVKDGIMMSLLTEMQMTGTVLDRNVSGTCMLVDPMEVDAKPPALVSSDNSVEVPQCGDQIPGNSSFPKCRDDLELAVDRDDDENSSGCTHPSTITNKALKPQVIGNPGIRKLLATKFWKAAPATKEGELSNTDTEMKPSFHSRRICYTRQRTRRSSLKRRKLFQRCSISTSDRKINKEANRISSSITGQISSYKSEDFHVKLSIKSFKVPELVIEIPETSTVGTLKRTVMEAVTTILGGGLRVGVLLQGKKVRDDNETLLKAGICHGDKLDDLGFTLEPSPMQAPPPLTSPKEPHFLFPCDATEPLTGFPVVAPASDGGKSDISPEPPLTSIINCPESDHDSVHSPTSTSSLDKTAAIARDLISIPAMSIKAMPMVPVCKPRCSELIQRRIRRPFSVSEVEALVQAVEKLGTGRWRDVKLRAFDNAKHRTYVDLKDKWKTLVHTARISPQQRRGEPVPQELLDRVLSVHAYWSQQVAKLQVKSPPC